MICIAKETFGPIMPAAKIERYRKYMKVYENIRKSYENMCIAMLSVIFVGGSGQPKSVSPAFLASTGSIKAVGLGSDEAARLEVTISDEHPGSYRSPLNCPFEAVVVLVVNDFRIVRIDVPTEINHLKLCQQFHHGHLPTS